MRSTLHTETAICLAAMAIASFGNFMGSHGANSISAAAEGFARLSPFTDLRYEADEKVSVEYEGQWYGLVSINDLTTALLLQTARESFGQSWQKRFAEDLVEVMEAAGQRPSNTVKLDLRRSGKLLTVEKAPMTAENRQQVYRNYRRWLTGPSEPGPAMSPIEGLNAQSARRQPRPVPSSNPFLSSVPGYPLWSAFTGVKWDGDQPIVRVEGKWYELVSFHAIPVERILQHCQENGWPVKMRFTEDLVQIVRLMGHEIDKTTDLELRDDDGNLVTMKHVQMTEANLRRIMSTRDLSESMTQEEVLQDLRAFQTSLESQFSYLKANGADYQAAIQKIAERAVDGMEATHLATELQKVMALFIDGHAGVSSSTASFAFGYLPFLIEPTGNRFVAVMPDRAGFVHAQYPYIEAIDGVELSRWLAATAKYIRKGPAPSVRSRGLRLLTFIEQFRQELGLARSKPLEVNLVSRDGSRRHTLSVDVSNTSPSYGTWPPVKTPEIMEGNIGYLRLEQMDGRAVSLLRQWMPRFRETKGLILDVRDNGGGIRTPILELAGYLLAKNDPPRIGNVAKYRLARHFGRDHLSAARFVYRENSGRFDQREREAVRRFKSDFAPEWEPPSDEFSEWHYLVLSKRPDDDRFDYRKPVAILTDGGCFSATDIFLGAFKGWPNVTLIGQSSAGGSARSQSFQLPRSGVSVRCASMASFQPNGKLYDTSGVTPDIAVVRPPEYYLAGGEDVILEQALVFLNKHAVQIQ